MYLSKNCKSSLCCIKRESMEAKESKFKFSNPIIKSSCFQTNENFKEDQYDGMTVFFESDLVNSKKNQTEMNLTIKVGDATEKYPFYIKVVMNAMFQWDVDVISEDKIEQLLKTNGTALLISYARPHIAYLTSNSGFNTYQLPFLDVSDSK